MKARERERDSERETENSNLSSKILILKDSSVRSIWTYLTASPCYTTNTNKHDNTTKREGGRDGGGERETHARTHARTHKLSLSV